MSQTDNEKLWFFLFCCLSILFHVSTTTNISINNELLNKALSYFNLAIYFSFKPIEVFFHEASHGLATIAMAKPFSSLHLTWHGAGHVVFTETSRLSMAIIAFTGYLGASVWGYLIYISSLHSKRISRFLLIAFCLSFVFKCDNLTTLSVMLMIISVFVFSWLTGTVGAYLLRFIAIFVMVSSIYSPTYLLKYNHQGDHLSMQEYTNIHANVWIGIWITIAALTLYKAFKASSNMKVRANNPLVSKNVQKS